MQPVKFLKFLRQFVVLVERNLQLIWNDKLLLASLTLQSPFMVLVVKLTADPNCFTSNLVNIGSRTALFVLAAMATFMGTLNSYREICREREIILREASVVQFGDGDVGWRFDLRFRCGAAGKERQQRGKEKSGKLRRFHDSTPG